MIIKNASRVAALVVAVAVVLIARANRNDLSGITDKDLRLALIGARGDMAGLPWESGGFAFGPAREAARIDRAIKRIEVELVDRDPAYFMRIE